eukprot:511401_1
MATKLVISVLSRNGSDMGVFRNLKESDTVEDLKVAFYRRFRKYAPERQWFTVGQGNARKQLKEGTLGSNGLTGEVTVTFKDLGAQIGWRTVFLVEYFGPLLMHAIPYYYPQLVYGVATPKRIYVQQVAFVLVMIHYLKREFETMFIHRFSHGTMPMRNIFKNSAHYWLVGGCLISYFLYHPLYTNPGFDKLTVNIFAGLFMFFEVGNFFAHVTLRNLRKPGSKERGIPQGGLFAFVSCANYSYEIAAWTVFAVLSKTLTAWIFVLISAAQMGAWAAKKHRTYRKEFKDYPPRRKALIPFIF